MADTKNDLNRIGLFSELGYVSVGDPYVNPNNKPFNVAAHKGKQMLPGGTKTKSSLQAGFFDKSFSRIMQGEGYSDPVKRRRQERLEKGKRNLGKAFMPSHAGKNPSGAGSHYGTFTGPIAVFSPVEKTKKPYVSPGRNFLTNPSKKGTGYGYTNVLIGKPQLYASEPYDRAKELMKNSNSQGLKMMKGGAFRLNLHPKAYFDNNPYKTDKPMPPYKEVKRENPTLKPFQPSSPGKEIGGSKAGCFTQYPSHSNDPYIAKKPFRENTGEKRIFRPSQGPKSMPTRSTITQNVERRINRLNFKEASLAPITI